MAQGSPMKYLPQCWKCKTGLPKSQWDKQVDTSLKEVYARFLSTKKDLLPGWKAKLLSFDVMPPEGESSFGPVIGDLIDKVVNDEAVDLVEVREALWKGAEKEAATNWLQRSDPSKTLVLTYAWGLQTDFAHYDADFNEYLVKAQLGQSVLPDNTYGKTDGG